VPRRYALSVAMSVLQFTPQAGHEQAGLRPAVTLSPRLYTRKSAGIILPVTNQVRVTHLKSPTRDLAVSGVALCDQVKASMGHPQSQIRLPAPDPTVAEIMAKVQTLLH